MAVKFQDYYQTLEVPRNAGAEEIRKAFRKMARKHHPDVNPQDKSAEEKFKQVNEAYEVLSDPEKRNKYDRLGENWKSGADFTPPPGWEGMRTEGADIGDVFGGGAGNFSDFFETLFGGRYGRGWAGGSTRGHDIEAELELPLKEADQGTTQTITLQATEICPECHGTGAKDKRPCPTCRSAGVVNRPKSLQVNIPPAVREGSVIRLAGQGESGGNGTPPGDLYLHIRLRPDPVFTPSGDDIQIELPISPWEAALGARVSVPTLNGSVDMTIPEGSQSGRRLRLRGQGLRRRDGGRGDQYVKLKIVNPTRINSTERDLFQKLAFESRFNPRDLMKGQAR